MNRHPYVFRCTLPLAVSLWLLLPVAVADEGTRAPVPSASPTLDLWAFDIEGDSVLGEAELYWLMQPYLGPNRTLADVDRARDRLEARYRDLGYKTVSVTIPRQTATDGVVRLRVVEGRVERLEVVGARYHSPERIRDEVVSLAEGQVPNFDAVREDIVALNRDRRLQVTPSVQPGRAPGALNVALAVQDELPLTASLEVNNRQSINTSPLRVVGTASYDNLFQRGHVLTLSYQTAPERTEDAQVLFLSYRAPLGRSRYTLLANAIRTDSDVAAVSGVNVVGRGEILGVRLLATLPSTERFYPSLSLGADYKNFGNAISTTTAEAFTPITYAPLFASFNVSSPADSGLTEAGLTVTFAVPQIGSRTADFDDSRFRARGQQLSLRPSLSHRQRLPVNLDASVRFAAQITDQPLISNEQLSAGGVDTVRGYLESEALGDYGFTASAELGWSPPVDGFAFGNGWAPVDELRLYGYVDGARLSLREALPGQTGTQLLSVGGGLSLSLFAHLSGSVDYAVPLLDGPQRQRGDGRLLFRVTSAY